VRNTDGMNLLDYYTGGGSWLGNPTVEPTKEKYIKQCTQKGAGEPECIAGINEEASQLAAAAAKGLQCYKNASGWTTSSKQKSGVDCVNQALAGDAYANTPVNDAIGYAGSLTGGDETVKERVVHWLRTKVNKDG